MKNKGFTLVELLAIIVVLGIITMIVVPVTNKIVKEAKIGAYKDSIKGINKVVENDCYGRLMDDEILNNVYSISDSKISPKIEYNGQLPETGIIVLDDKCKVTDYDIQFSSENPDSHFKEGDGINIIKSYASYNESTSSYEAVNEDFRSSTYLTKIKNIYFKQDLTGITSTSWDISNDANGEIKAWVKDNGSYYDLYIGSKNIILANNISSYLFSGMTSLTNIDFTNFNTSYISDISNMFYNDTALVSLNLGKFNTSNIKNMSNMFYGCKGLTNLNLSGFNTSKVNNMSGMFSKCDNLKNLDISGFDTTNVTNMNNMFDSCTNIVTLNLKTFSNDKLNSANEMFKGTTKLSEVFISNKWDIDKIYENNNMFINSGVSTLTKISS